MAEVRPLRRIATATAWLLATSLAPCAFAAQSRLAPEQTSCAVGQIEAAGFRQGTAAGPLGASSAIADFNRDGRPDVAIADRADQTGESHRFRLEVVLAGLNTVTLDVDSTESALALSVADVDHDHDLDIVLSRPLSGETVSVWLNDGTGRFTAAPAGTFRGPAHPLAAVGARIVDSFRASQALPSRACTSIVPVASVNAADDRRVLPADAPAPGQTHSRRSSRPRSPPVPSSRFA